MRRIGDLSPSPLREVQAYLSALASTVTGCGEPRIGWSVRDPAGPSRKVKFLPSVLADASTRKADLEAATRHLQAEFRLAIDAMVAEAEAIPAELATCRTSGVCPVSDFGGTTRVIRTLAVAAGAVAAGAAAAGLSPWVSARSSSFTVTMARTANPKMR